MKVEKSFEMLETCQTSHCFGNVFENFEKIEAVKTLFFTSFARVCFPSTRNWNLTKSNSE